MGMFDVGDKSETLRIATARAIIKVSPETICLIKEGRIDRGRGTTKNYLEDWRGDGIADRRVYRSTYDL
jgi:hypothetical protein